MPNVHRWITLRFLFSRGIFPTQPAAINPSQGVVVKNTPSRGGGCPGQGHKPARKAGLSIRAQGAARPSNSGRGFQIPTHQNLVASKAEEASAALAFPPLQKKSPSLTTQTRRRTQTLENYDSFHTFGVGTPSSPLDNHGLSSPLVRENPSFLTHKHFK